MSRKAKFGLFSPQAGMTFKGLVERAQLAERLDYHSLWLVDHFWTRGLPDLDHLECLTAMSGLAAHTHKLRIGSLVLCHSFRNPALLAKALTTIDHISNGRLEIGLGAGWMDEEYRGYGYDFPPAAVRLKQLEEGLQISEGAVHREARQLQGPLLQRRRRAQQSQAGAAAASAHHHRRQRREGDA